MIYATEYIVLGGFFKKNLKIRVSLHEIECHCTCGDKILHVHTDDGQVGPTGLYPVPRVD